MPDSLAKVEIPVPIPGLLPPELPPGIPPVQDDPTERIKEAIRNARNKPAHEEPPAYTPNPMGNIEDDLADHPGFFDDNQRTKYDPFHVELILDGAGDILARALGDRAAYDQFRDRYYERTLELNYLQSQLALDELEFETGAWDRPVQQAVVELASAKARQTGLTGRSAARDAALQTSPFDVEHQATLVATGVRAAMAGAFKSPNQEIAKVTSGGDPSGSDVPANELVYGSNLESTRAGISRELLNFKLEKEGESDLLESLKGQISLAEKSVGIETALTELRKKRFSALQAYQAERTKALTGPDGPHNALMQMKAIQDRFGRDMVDLYDRLLAVSRGVDLIYGIDLPPSSPSLCAEKGTSFLDVSVAWVRNIVRYLNARATHDRTITLSYSVRQLVGNSAFDKAVAKAKETGEGIRLTFPIPIPADRVLRFPRLRGVSCYSHYADTATYRGVFSLRLTPPPFAYMALEKTRMLLIEPPKWPDPALPQLLGNSIGGNDARPWDDSAVFTRWGDKLVRVQKERTPAFVSRVAPRFPLRAPEIFAGDSLFNISPFGAPAAPGENPAQWALAIDAKTTIGNDVAAALEDLELDFYLLATPE